MLRFQATYKLTVDNGTSTYISRPFKTKEEAKKDLYDELERLEEDDELNNMTYCNIIEESDVNDTHQRDTCFIDLLNHLFTPPYNEETGEVEESKGFTIWGEPAEQELKDFNLKKINKKLEKLYKKRIELDEKIEATKDLIMPPKAKRIDSLKEHLENRKGYLGVDISRRKDIS